MEAFACKIEIALIDCEVGEVVEADRFASAIAGALVNAQDFIVFGAGLLVQPSSSGEVSGVADCDGISAFVVELFKVANGLLILIGGGFKLSFVDEYVSEVVARNGDTADSLLLRVKGECFLEALFGFVELA